MLQLSFTTSPGSRGGRNPRRGEREFQQGAGAESSSDSAKLLTSPQSLPLQEHCLSLENFERLLKASDLLLLGSGVGQLFVAIGLVFSVLPSLSLELCDHII